MRTEIIYIADDGTTFTNKKECKAHDDTLAKDNDAFVITSATYGQYRGMTKTHKEAEQFIRKSGDSTLRIEKVSLGKYGLVKV